MLIDQAIIKVRSGRGGDGAVSFRREKYIPKGGPDGGDGGVGGSVYLRANPSIDTLLDYAGRTLWSAQDGTPGSMKQCAGKNGRHLELDVPPGTVVYNNLTGELIVDLDLPGKRVRILRGGQGGYGNEHFKTPTQQAPRIAEKGESGQELELRLELKLIADIGLLGMPNAGKSTLLSRISRARPKIAAYPFTTLEPQLGIAEITGARRMVVADIPGLIEGASRGAGLGVQFLRHIERTRLLIHLVEIEPADGSDPATNYRTIREELARYSPDLAAKPEVLVLSKLDLLESDEDRQAAVELFEQALGRKVEHALSAATGLGVGGMLEACWEKLVELRAAQPVTVSQPGEGSEGMEGEGVATLDLSPPGEGKSVPAPPPAIFELPDADQEPPIGAE